MKQAKRNMLFINSMIMLIPELLFNLCSKVKNVEIRTLLTVLSIEIIIFILMLLIIYYLLEYLLDYILAKNKQVFTIRLKNYFIFTISFIIAKILYENQTIFIETIEKYGFYLYLYKLGFTWN